MKYIISLYGYAEKVYSMRILLFLSGLLFLSFNTIAFDSMEHVWSGTEIDLKWPAGHSQDYSKEFPYRAAYELMVDPKNNTKIGTLVYRPQYLIIRDTIGDGQDASNNAQSERTLKLSFGEIIAFGGDFLGREGTNTIARGISLKDFDEKRDELKANFKDAFKSLIPYENNPFHKKNNIAYLQSLMEKEFQSLILTLSKPYGVHFNNASAHSIISKVKDQWIYATYGYFDLLSNNVDHFEDAARISYGIGHTLALEEAKEAGELFKDGKQEEAIARLNMAYAKDAFSSHYLTDLFSAGHLRTPRDRLLSLADSRLRRLQGYTSSNVGLMANAIHDEDNLLGLWVKDADGQVWNQFGDGSYFDIKSVDNRHAIREALQASIDEIFVAFETGELPKFKNFKALRQVGVPLESVSDTINELGNHYPLFKIGKEADAWPQVREDYYDPYKNKYVAITSLTGISSFIKNDLGTYNHGNFYSFNEPWRVKPLERDVQIECYNTFNRNSNLPPKEDELVILKDPVEAILIDNSQVKFYKRILLGNLRPDGTYFVISQALGEDIKDLCRHAMETNYKLEDLGKVKSSEVVEIRARVSLDNHSNPSRPVAITNNLGQLVRLLGHESGDSMDLQ